MPLGYLGSLIRDVTFITENFINRLTDLHTHPFMVTLVYCLFIFREDNS